MFQLKHQQRDNPIHFKQSYITISCVDLFLFVRFLEFPTFSYTDQSATVIDRIKRLK